MNLWRVFSVVRARQRYVEWSQCDDKPSQIDALYDPALVARILYYMEPEGRVTSND